MAKTITIEDLRDRVAARLSEHGLTTDTGGSGTLSIALARRATRTFRAHWTGFKIFYPERLIVLYLKMNDGKFWSEGYLSPALPSWVLAFRDAPHKSRGSGGPRPDDQVATPQSVERDLENRKRWVEAGVVGEEELIRMEDFDDPLEAVDGFFYYTSYYVLKSVNASWDQIGYIVDPSLEWKESDTKHASLPMSEAIDEGLKKSDILWLTPNTAPDRPIPCWFLYTRDKRIFVLSGERQQVIPRATEVRNARVITRWKMRDARMAEFETHVRAITPSEREEFVEIAEQLVNKRQSVRESSDETIERWLRDCVILELKPRR
jgi:hypothetical protein